MQNWKIWRMKKRGINTRKYWTEEWVWICDKRLVEGKRKK
jgi:hypothetical protein